jgi:hypothetical protein
LVTFGGWTGPHEEKEQQAREGNNQAQGEDTPRTHPSAYLFDLDAKEWVQPEIAGRPPGHRYGMPLTASGPLVVLFGGYEGGRPMNDVVCLDLSAMAVDAA